MTKKDDRAEAICLWAFTIFVAVAVIIFVAWPWAR
jgi:hypothetical protein